VISGLPGSVSVIAYFQQVVKSKSRIAFQPMYEHAPRHRQRPTRHINCNLRNGGAFIRYSAPCAPFGCRCYLESVDCEYRSRRFIGNPSGALPSSRNGGVGVAHSCWSVCV
jgi:hypothetical protein